MLARLASMRCASRSCASSQPAASRALRGARDPAWRNSARAAATRHGYVATRHRRPSEVRGAAPLVVFAAARSASTASEDRAAAPGERESADGEDASPEERAPETNLERRSYRPGIFTRLPSVAAAAELKASARKRATRATPGKGLKDAAREKSLGVKRLEAMTSAYCTPLKTYVKGFPNPDRFHPFERALLEGNRTITEGVMFSEEDWSECASLADMSSADGEESDVSGPSKKDRDWLARLEELKRFHALHGHYQVSWTD